MPLFSRSGFAFRIFWITMALVLVALWSAIGYLHQDSEERELASARRDVANLSLAFAEHTRTSFQQVDTLLRQLRKSWMDAPSQFTEQVKLLQSTTEDMAFQVAVIGADGFLEYSNLAFARDRVDLSDREHFRVPRDYARQGLDWLFVSRPIKGRVSGRWSIQFSRPIIGPRGFLGVLVVSIDPAYFSRFYGAIDLGAGGIVAMVRDTGEFLTRAPRLDESLGIVAKERPFLARDAPLRGGYRRVSDIDGVTRIYGFHRLPTFGVTLVVGLDEHDVLADVRARQLYENVAAAAVTAVVLLMMLVVARAQRAEARSRASLTRSAEELRRVQAVIPTGLVMLDAKGDIVECNPAAERILHATREQLLAHAISIADWNAVRSDGTPIAPRDLPAAVALRTQRPVVDVEMRIQLHDHPPAWLLVSAMPTGDPRRPVVVAFGDVTEQKSGQQRIAASEARFRALFDSFTDTVFVVDTSGRLSMVHVSASEPAPFDTAGWIGRSIEDVLPEAAALPLTEALAEVLGDAAPRTLALSIGEDGSLRHYRATISLLQGAATWPEGFVIVLHDVTAEREMAEAQRVAATTFESQEGMMITDGKGLILRVNRAFTELTGYEAEEVVGKSPSVLKSGRQSAEFYQSMWGMLRATGYWQGEVWNRRKGGELYPEWLTISAVADEQGRTTHYVGAFSDITERKEAEERIRHLAFYDPLTQLPNRRLLGDRLAQALAAGQRTRFYGALLYIDLDHFKVLNDTRGHDAGDELLAQMAERLGHSVREQDTVARLGGDEFVVMLEDLDLDESVAATLAGAIAEKIRHSLEQVFPLAGGDYSISPSIGVSLFRGHESDVQTLMKQADMALYEAKEEGRNTVRFYSHAMQEAVTAQAAVLSGLRQALESDQFELHLQAQFDGKGRRIGAEALLRWRREDSTLVPPDAFIPHAESSGLIVQIGTWVLERACQILAAWSVSRPDERLSVNVSARQFRQPDFVEIVSAALARYRVDASRLCLELTETAVLGDLEFASRTMATLREIGVEISMDDFGTGYSSLSNLRCLPISEVKIDRSFVQEVERVEQDAAIIRSIISMCHSLGLSVVAEGVETDVQRAFLMNCQCDVLQGFLLGRPSADTD